MNQEIAINCTESEFENMERWLASEPTIKRVYTVPVQIGEYACFHYCYFGIETTFIFNKEQDITLFLLMWT